MASTALTVTLHTVIGSDLTPLTAPPTTDVILLHRSCNSAAIQVHLSYFQLADLIFILTALLTLRRLSYGVVANIFFFTYIQVMAGIKKSSANNKIYINKCIYTLLFINNKINQCLIILYNNYCFNSIGWL